MQPGMRPEQAQEDAGAAAALARGKRAKLRRAKEKYAGQDAEDRALALEVLAPAGAPSSPEPVPRLSLLCLAHMRSLSTMRSCCCKNNAGG